MLQTITQSLLSENDTLQLSMKLASAIHDGAIIFLYGPLGVGKTTFVRGFFRGLGFHGKVKSPTYTLVEPYTISTRTVFHFDFYRLKNAEELEYIGIHDYFSSHAICLIEWPENGISLLPPSDINCYFSFAKKGRTIRMEGHSLQGKNILIECFS